MPDRIVRAGILSSDPVNALSWAAEVFYRRLFSVVDDFGLYDGRHSMLRAHLYPVKLDRVSESDVGKWLTECVNAGLVRLYPAKGQMFLQVLKFDQRARAKSSKWPLPPDSADTCQQESANDVICRQALADSSVFVFEDVFECENPPDPPAGGKVEAPVGLSTWLERIKAQGEKPVPEGHHVFEYADKAGIPAEYLELAWLEFKRRYSQPGAKRYKDWRAVFRKAVEGNWLKLWWVDPRGDYALTTAGQQAKRLVEAA